MFSTLRPHNILPMAAAGLQNLDLTLYLIKELMASKEKKLQALKEFIPDAKLPTVKMSGSGRIDVCHACLA